MRTGALWLMVLLLAIVVQKVVLSGFAGIGPRPDLMLVIAVSAGLLGGKETGMGIGFFAGVLQDLSSGNVFGLNIFPKMAAGYLAGIMESKVFKENIFLPALLAAVATFLNGIIISVFLYILGYLDDFGFFILNQILPAVLYNIIIAVPAHHLVHRVLYRHKTQNNGSF